MAWLRWLGIAACVFVESRALLVVLARRYAARRIPRDALEEAWPAEQRILDRLVGDRKARRHADGEDATDHA